MAVFVATNPQKDLRDLEFAKLPFNDFVGANRVRPSFGHNSTIDDDSTEGVCNTPLQLNGIFVFSVSLITA